jgi:TetR/AcrR family transcriptional repressor of nem operon
MRYEKGHKEATRRRIIETAASRFRKDGIEAVGVADLMAEAGLTHGGFYSHFASKEDLVRATVEEVAPRAKERFKQRVADGGLENYIRFYLGPSHRDHPEAGCLISTLAAELARRPKTSREPLSKNLAALTDEIGSYLPGKLSATQRRQTAVGIFALLVGALQMARAVNEPSLSDEIMEAGIASALALAGIKPASA